MKKLIHFFCCGLFVYLEISSISNLNLEILRKLIFFLPAHHFLYLEFAKSKCKIEVGEYAGISWKVGCSKEGMLGRAENKLERDRKQVKKTVRKSKYMESDKKIKTAFVSTSIFHITISVSKTAIFHLIFCIQSKWITKFPKKNFCETLVVKKKN